MKFTHIALIITPIILSGCALFKSARLADSPEKAKKRICLNSEGKGRFLAQGQKHVFSYQSHLSEQDLSWRTVIDFPMYGRESIEMEWDKERGEGKYDASYEQALLKNSENLDPALLEGAATIWLEFFEDMLISRGLLKKDRGERIDWVVTDKTLEGELAANGHPASITFLNPVSKGHFGRFDFKLLSDKGAREFGMELIVRNCLE